MITKCMVTVTCDGCSKDKTVKMRTDTIGFDLLDLRRALRPSEWRVRCTSLGYEAECMTCWAKRELAEYEERQRV